MTHYVQTTKPKWAITAFRGFIASETHLWNNQYMKRLRCQGDNKMPKVGKWKKVKKNSKQTVWRNTTSKEEIIVKKSYTYPIAFQTRAEAEDDAIAYMRDFPEGKKTYYGNIFLKKKLRR